MGYVVKHLKGLIKVICNIEYKISSAAQLPKVDGKKIYSKTVGQYSIN